ncbi:MAG: hypothetical protein NY202_02360 [Mollicutes bacterium UO1]
MRDDQSSKKSGSHDDGSREREVHEQSFFVFIFIIVIILFVFSRGSL